jgi:hypothetical protein
VWKGSGSQYQLVSSYACGVDNMIVYCPAGWQVVSGGGDAWANECGGPVGGVLDTNGRWMDNGLDASFPTSDMGGWWIGGMHDAPPGDNLEGWAICMKQ